MNLLKRLACWMQAILTGKQLKVVWLRVVCQLSSKEIAKKMHTTPGAVRQIIFRLRHNKNIHPSLKDYIDALRVTQKKTTRYDPTIDYHVKATF